MWGFPTTPFHTLFVLFAETNLENSERMERKDKYETVHPQYFVWTSKQRFHFIIYLTDKTKQKTSESLWYFGLVMIHLLHCILCSTCITIGPGQRWAENQTGLKKKRIYSSRNYRGCQMLRILFIFFCCAFVPIF